MNIGEAIKEMRTDRKLSKGTSRDVWNKPKCTLQH